jgi:hypothetical protein
MPYLTSDILPSGHYAWVRCNTCHELLRNIMNSPMFFIEQCNRCRNEKYKELLVNKQPHTYPDGTKFIIKEGKIVKLD